MPPQGVIGTSSFDAISLTSALRLLRNFWVAMSVHDDPSCGPSTARPMSPRRRWLLARRRHSNRPIDRTKRKREKLTYTSFNGVLRESNATDLNFHNAVLFTFHADLFVTTCTKSGSSSLIDSEVVSMVIGAASVNKAFLPL